jgi:signal-transduction protein with cAMP-binding, CBS, and nucleotidyltransferase domain
MTFPAGSVIINRGEKSEYLYLIEKGEVIVAEHKFGAPLAYLPKYAIFGDYQLFLDTYSNVNFNASLNEKVYCYTLHKSIFLSL